MKRLLFLAPLLVGCLDSPTVTAPDASVDTGVDATIDVGPDLDLGRDANVANTKAYVRFIWVGQDEIIQLGPEDDVSIDSDSGALAPNTGHWPVEPGDFSYTFRGIPHTATLDAGGTYSFVGVEDPEPRMVTVPEPAGQVGLLNLVDDTPLSVGTDGTAFRRVGYGEVDLIDDTGRVSVHLFDSPNGLPLGSGEASSLMVLAGHLSLSNPSRGLRLAQFGELKHTIDETEQTFDARNMAGEPAHAVLGCSELYCGIVPLQEFACSPSEGQAVVVGGAKTFASLAESGYAQDVIESERDDAPHTSVWVLPDEQLSAVRHVTDSPLFRFSHIAADIGQVEVSADGASLGVVTPGETLEAATEPNVIQATEVATNNTWTLTRRDAPTTEVLLLRTPGGPQLQQLTERGCVFDGSVAAGESCSVDRQCETSGVCYELNIDEEASCYARCADTADCGPGERCVWKLFSGADFCIESQDIEQSFTAPIDTEIPVSFDVTLMDLDLRFDTGRLDARPEIAGFTHSLVFANTSGEWNLVVFSWPHGLDIDGTVQADVQLVGRASGTTIGWGAGPVTITPVADSDAYQVDADLWLSPWGDFVP